MSKKKRKKVSKATAKKAGKKTGKKVSKKAGKKKAAPKKPDASVETKPATPPPPVIDDKTPHEAIRHVVGANPPREGQLIDLGDEARRIRALKIEVQRLATELGLDVRPSVTYTPDETPTQRAQDIKEIAAPKMAEAADEFSIMRETIEIKDDKGRSIKIAKTHVKALGLLKNSIGGIAALIGAPFKYAIGLSVKFGTWAKVQLSGKAEGE